MKQQLTIILCLIFFAPLVVAADMGSEFFAIVNKEKIPAQEFFEEFQKGVRETFYHGKVTEKELENFREKVVKNLVNEKLLLQRANNQGIKPRKEQVAKKIEKETELYRKQANWEKSKDAIIASVRPKIEKEDILEQLEERTRNIPQPDLDAVRKYYKKHADKFTAPEKWNVSLILLEVDPSSPSMVLLRKCVKMRAMASCSPGL